MDTLAAEFVRPRSPGAKGREVWTRGYWLEHCEGYRVDLPDGHYVGFVEDVVSDADDNEPIALDVWFNRGFEVLPVPIALVYEISPLDERVTIDRVPSP